MRAPLPGASALLCLLFASTPSLAEEADDPRHDAAWSFGAGVGLINDYDMLLAIDGLGGLGGTPSAPPMSLFVERRLDEAVWLGLAVRGSRLSSSDSDETSDVTSGGVAVQLRCIVAARGPVEFSLQVNAGAGLGSSQTDYTVESALRDRTVRSTTTSLTGGLSIETMLTSSLALRLSSTLLSLAHTSRDAVYAEAAEQPGTQSHATDTSLNLRFLPAVELRWYL